MPACACQLRLRVELAAVPCSSTVASLASLCEMQTKVAPQGLQCTQLLCGLRLAGTHFENQDHSTSDVRFP